MLNWRKNWKFVPSDNLMCTFPSMCITTGSSGQSFSAIIVQGRTYSPQLGQTLLVKSFYLVTITIFPLEKKGRRGEGGGLHPGGYSWESLVGVCRSDPPNPDPISDQKISFLQKILYHYYLDQSSNIKDFLKTISNSRISPSFLLIWN